MVKDIDDLFLYDSFQIAKIDHHSILHVVVVRNGSANNRNRQLVTVPVHIPAFAVISIKGMTRFEGKNLGDPNLFHCKKIDDKDTIFQVGNSASILHQRNPVFLTFPSRIKVGFLPYIWSTFYDGNMAEELFGQLEFVENRLFETIIDDLIAQKYSVVNNFFPSEEVEGLRKSLQAKYEADKFKKSAIGNQFNAEIDRSIRGDFILWMDERKANEAESLFFTKINDLVNYLNKTCFLGILHKEFHYAVYPQGTYYKRHLDTFQNDDRRKLSMVCYLNEDNWLSENGGELTIYTENQTLDILPLPGRVVIFESQVLEHEVKIVKASERLSITGWLKTR